MDFTSVSEVIEFMSTNGPFAAQVNAYLKNGWTMLQCCTQPDESDDAQCVYVLLGWFSSKPATHLGVDFNLSD